MSRPTTAVSQARASFVNDSVATRTEAVAEMSGKLQEKFKVLENSLNDARTSSLRYYWRIGEICADIKNNPNDYVGVHGTPGLKLIKNALNIHVRLLNKAIKFYNCYDTNQLEELINLENPDSGFKLNWSHVSYLLTLQSAEERAQYAQTAVADMLDPPTLSETIRQVEGRTEGHGRPHQLPETIMAQVRQIRNVSRNWLRKYSDVWNGTENNVYSNLVNLPVEDADVDIANLLAEVTELIVQMQDSLEFLGELNQSALVHVNNLLEGNTPADANNVVEDVRPIPRNDEQRMILPSNNRATNNE